MELKDFVKETLSQIAEGIEAAQESVRECGGFVNPAHRVDPKGSNDSHFGVLNNGQNIFLVDFDVSVTVVEDKGNEASAKLQVASLLKIGSGVETSSSNKATNKISFKVPIGLPIDGVSAEQLKQQDQRIREKRKKQADTLQNRSRIRGGIREW
ncbi:hypothetical protein Q2E61_14300 [Microbulbifer thermotolerans]|uniref:hypothetical protein n=1 Tax=Microbulbifer thermotolerans TaxID=252514 RepID=UPI002672AA89|nr:hypothetical protein [Microbulbifer thermotolerans]WKT60065.1 hypothetical protein Q2E61_14300 [Microbulbifer thermotolerans]